MTDKTVTYKDIPAFEIKNFDLFQICLFLTEDDYYQSVINLIDLNDDGTVKHFLTIPLYHTCGDAMCAAVTAYEFGSMAALDFVSEIDVFSADGDLLEEYLDFDADAVAEFLEDDEEETE